MSKAVIEFCRRLETTLLGIEEQLGKAQKTLAEGAARSRERGCQEHHPSGRALSGFRAKAGEMAASLRAELPEKVEHMQDRLKDYGSEAQTAMRHARPSRRNRGQERRWRSRSAAQGRRTRPRRRRRCAPRHRARRRPADHG